MRICVEALDYAFQKERRIPSKEDYQKIAELKSASLIATCCNIAAVFKKDKLAKRLHSFGKNMGIAFQMRDDILDTINDGDGKGRMSNFRPSIVATLMEHSSLTGKEAVGRAIKLHNSYIDKAVKELGSFGAAELLAVYADSVRVN